MEHGETQHSSHGITTFNQESFDVNNSKEKQKIENSNE